MSTYRALFTSYSGEWQLCAAACPHNTRHHKSSSDNQEDGVECYTTGSLLTRPWLITDSHVARPTARYIPPPAEHPGSSLSQTLTPNARRNVAGRHVAYTALMSTRSSVRDALVSSSDPWISTIWYLAVAKRTSSSQVITHVSQVNTVFIREVCYCITSFCQSWKWVNGTRTRKNYSHYFCYHNCITVIASWRKIHILSSTNDTLY